MPIYTVGKSASLDFCFAIFKMELSVYKIDCDSKMLSLPTAKLCKTKSEESLSEPLLCNPGKVSRGESVELYLGREVV